MSVLYLHPQHMSQFLVSEDGWLMHDKSTKEFHCECFYVIIYQGLYLLVT